MLGHLFAVLRNRPYAFLRRDYVVLSPALLAKLTDNQGISSMARGMQWGEASCHPVILRKTILSTK